MIPLEIRSPLWNGGRRCVGIAEFKLGTRVTDIKITYRNKDGVPIYPHVFTIDTVDARKFPTMKLRSGINLRMIPIDALKIREANA